MTQGDETMVAITYAQLPKSVKKGQRILVQAIGDGRDGGQGGANSSAPNEPDPCPLLADEGFRGSAMCCQDGTVILIVEECGDDYVMCKAWKNMKNHGFEI